MNVIDHFRSKARKTNIAEQQWLTKIFPALRYELDTILVLDDKLMSLTSGHNTCSDFYCIDQKIKTDIYLRENNTYIESLFIKSEELMQDICSLPKYLCQTTFLYEAKYNCIGLALGIIHWIEPRIINDLLSEGVATEQVLNKFLQWINIRYSSDHPANFFGILEKLEYLTDDKLVVKNNTVALYFKDGNCTHASRYIAEFDSWISKLGHEIPINHSIDGLKGGAYGDEIYFLGILESDEGLINQEL